MWIFDFCLIDYTTPARPGQGREIMENAENDHTLELAESGGRGILKFIDVSIFITMVASFLYTAGWAFAYRYFEQFHVGMSALDLQREYYFIYGFQVMLDHPFLMCFILLIICLGLFLAPLVGPRLSRSSDAAVVFFFLVLALAAFFWTGYKLGRTTAESRFHEERAKDYPAYPRVVVRLKHGSSPTSPGAALPREKARLKKGCHRLLFQGKDKIFVFRAIGDVLAADLPTIVIPMSEVESFEILPQYSSCTRKNPADPWKNKKRELMEKLSGLREKAKK